MQVESRRRGGRELLGGGTGSGCGLRSSVWMGRRVRRRPEETGVQTNCLLTFYIYRPFLYNITLIALQHFPTTLLDKTIEITPKRTKMPTNADLELPLLETNSIRFIEPVMIAISPLDRPVRPG